MSNPICLFQTNNLSIVRYISHTSTLLYEPQGVCEPEGCDSIPQYLSAFLDLHDAYGLKTGKRPRICRTIAWPVRHSQGFEELGSLIWARKRAPARMRSRCEACCRQLTSLLEHERRLTSAGRQIFLSDDLPHLRGLRSLYSSR